MSREPDWWRMGFRMAKGSRKSTLGLPEDFFDSQQDRLTKDNFNLLKFSYSYAVAWLETEQWKSEVGQNIRRYVKKHKHVETRVNEFISRAFFWVAGYAYYINEEFTLYWNGMCPHMKCNITDENIQTLADQAMFDDICLGCKKPLDLKRDTYYIYNSMTTLSGYFPDRTINEASYYHVKCLKKMLRKVARETIKSGCNRKTIKEICTEEIKRHTLHQGKQ